MKQTDISDHESSDKTRIQPHQVIERLPWIAKKIPSLLKGYYYFALLKANKALTMADVLSKTAEKLPNHPAIRFDALTITYAELDAWANRMAHVFQGLGLGPGDCIAINLENRPELFAALMAANKLGAAAAMLNTSQQGPTLAHSIKLTQPKLLIMGEEQREKTESALSGLADSKAIQTLWLADEDTRTGLSEAPDGYPNLGRLTRGQSSSMPEIDRPRLAGDTAVYLFTSGTTGLPKASPSSHRKWFKAFGGFGHMSLSMTPKDALYVTLPFYHGTALLVCWGAVLAGGSTLIVRRKFSASAFWDDVRRYEATGFGYVGELCRYLLTQPASPGDRQHQAKMMIGNGLRPSLWQAFKERFGVDQVCELYGASEGNIGFSNFLNLNETVGFTTASYALVRFHRGTNQPIRNAAGYLERVSAGEPGLLLGKITSKWNFEGYTQPEATEKAIIRGAFKTNDAWFNTGDVLRDIGCRHLQFVDRMGDTFRWKGENVSSTEVENTLDGFPGIQEAIVYGVEIPKTDGKAGMATLVLSPDCPTLDREALLHYLMQQLPHYAVPVFLRITDRIEKTGTFKYRKVEVKDKGFQLDDSGDRVLILRPGESSYSPLDIDTCKELTAGKLRF